MDTVKVIASYVSSASKEISLVFFLNQKINYGVYYWFLIVSQMNPVHTFHSHSFKVKLFRIVTKTQKVGRNVVFPSLVSHSAQLRQHRNLQAPAAFIPKTVSWYPLLLGAEYTARLLNANGRNSSLQNFQGLYRQTLLFNIILAST